MGIANRLTVPSRTYDVGETIVNLPQKAARQYETYKVSFSRESWPAGVDCVLDNGVTQANVAMQISFERSTDDGLNWSPAGGATFPGGTVLDRAGQPVIESSIMFGATDAVTRTPVVQTARLRIVVRRLVPLTTGVTVEVVEP